MFRVNDATVPIGLSMMNTTTSDQAYVQPNVLRFMDWEP